MTTQKCKDQSAQIVLLKDVMNALQTGLEARAKMGTTTRLQTRNQYVVCVPLIPNLHQNALSVQCQTQKVCPLLLTCRDPMRSMQFSIDT